MLQLQLNFGILCMLAFQLRHLSNYDLKKFPNEVIEHEKMLLHPDSRVRPDAEQMGKV